MSPHTRNKIGWLLGLSSIFGGIPLTAFATWAFFAGGIVQDVKILKTEIAPTVRQLQLTTAELNAVLKTDLSKLCEISNRTIKNEKDIQYLESDIKVLKVNMDNQNKTMEEIRSDIKDIKKMLTNHLTTEPNPIAKFNKL